MLYPVCFYLHYETVNDLLAESARYIIDRFIEAMPHDTAEFMANLQTRPLEELYLVTPEYLTPYLNYIKAHRRIFRTTVEQASALGMNDVYLRGNAMYSRRFLTVSTFRRPNRNI